MTGYQNKGRGVDMSLGRYLTPDPSSGSWERMGWVIRSLGELKWLCAQVVVSKKQSVSGWWWSRCSSVFLSVTCIIKQKALFNKFAGMIKIRRSCWYSKEDSLYSDWPWETWGLGQHEFQQQQEQIFACRRLGTGWLISSLAVGDLGNTMKNK